MASSVNDAGSMELVVALPWRCPVGDSKYAYCVPMARTAKMMQIVPAEVMPNVEASVYAIESWTSNHSFSTAK